MQSFATFLHSCPVPVFRVHSSAICIWLCIHLQSIPFPISDLSLFFFHWLHLTFVNHFFFFAYFCHQYLPPPNVTFHFAGEKKYNLPPHFPTASHFKSKKRTENKHTITGKKCLQESSFLNVAVSLTYRGSNLCLLSAGVRCFKEDTTHFEGIFVAIVAKQ